uniref:Uncharacterized protein n=1 Tax=uncultured prokaryote TaxID=198431 RepID=A0A0H5Q4F2_9ZZZZ|nr:hypothetical protein [uncultured prokaryote]
MAIQHVKALVTYTVGNRPGANVLHFAVDEATIITNQKLADDFNVQWAIYNNEDAAASACIYTGVKLTADDKTWQAFSSASKPGTATGEMSSPGVAFLMRYVLNGTTVTGRSYIPGVPEAAINSNGVVTGGTVTYLQDQMEDFWDKMATDYTGLLQEVKMKDGSFKGVASTSVDSLICTQRRRLRG